MRIIKKGKLSDHNKIFECEHCGCVYEVNPGEYYPTDPALVKVEKYPPFYSGCPYCGRIVYNEL